MGAPDGPVEAAASDPLDESAPASWQLQMAAMREELERAEAGRVQGLEDHHGDMDFKVAGTADGITGVQLDIKPAGVPLPVRPRRPTPAGGSRGPWTRPGSPTPRSAPHGAAL